MVNDPYRVLGVSREATKDEIKAAYRKKAKQYHPDLHPNDEKAAEKMNEVNEAYDMLSNPEKYQRTSAQGFQEGRGGYQSNAEWQRRSGTEQYYWSYDFDDIFGFGSARQGIPKPVHQATDTPQMREAINFINQERYGEAAYALQQVISRERTARWHYLSALANYGLGNQIRALEEIQFALQLEPGNSVYQQIYASMNINSTQYQDMGSQYARAAQGMQRFCMSLCWLNCLCGCC